MSDDFDITSPTSPCVSEYAPKRKAPKATKPKPKPKPKPKRLDLASLRAEAVRAEGVYPASGWDDYEEPRAPSPDPIREYADGIRVCGIALESVGCEVWWRPAIAAVERKHKPSMDECFGRARSIRDSIRATRPRDSLGWVERAVVERFQGCVMQFVGYALGLRAFDDAGLVWLRIEAPSIHAYVTYIESMHGESMDGSPL